MGQKVNPIGLRVTVNKNWRSRWYANKQEFGKLLVEDQRIRQFIKREYEFAGIPKIEIERDRERVHIFLARELTPARQAACFLYPEVQEVSARKPEAPIAK